MAEIEWKDKRSDTRKVVTFDILDIEGKPVAEVQHLFDPKDQPTLAGAVMEINQELKEGYRLIRIDSTLGEERKKFVQKVVRKYINSAC